MQGNSMLERPNFEQLQRLRGLCSWQISIKIEEQTIQGQSRRPDTGPGLTFRALQCRLFMLSPNKVICLIVLEVYLQN